MEWMNNFSWRGWPERRAINPMQEAAARKVDLEIGGITYEDIHGPLWRRVLRGLGEQIKWSRDNGFFTNIFKPESPKGGATAQQNAVKRLFGKGSR